MYLYYIYDENHKIIYREYRFEYAYKFYINEPKAKKLYLVEKTLKPMKVLAMWKDANNKCIFLFDNVKYYALQ